MYDGVRRLSVLLIVGSLALLTTYFVRGKSGSYDLFDLLRGEKAAPPVPTTPLDPAATPPPPVVPDPSTEPPPPQQAMTPRASSRPVSILAQLSNDRAILATSVLGSVVSVEGTRKAKVQQRYRRQPAAGYLVPEARVQPRQGSGVIVRKDGHVVTNHHVIDGMDSIVITTHTRERNSATVTSERYSATVVGFDAVIDIAVLKINVEPDQRFVPLPFGDSDRIRDGEMVFAVGSPFGLDGTITDGVISSAVPRRSSDSGPPLIQTNTVLNKGNSGGPLVNVYGEIIGINRAIYNGPGSVDEQMHSYGLAIPANAVRSAMDSILNQAVPMYGYLGVYVADVALVDAFAHGLTDTKGCVVTGALAGSPAHRAGLQKNDVILAYDGQEVSTARDLLALIQGTPIGKNVDLKVWRDKTPELITATIQDQGSVSVPEPLEVDVKRVWDIAGIEVKYVTSRDRRRRGYEPSFPMVQITAVRNNSTAADIRLEPGFLVHYIDRDPTDTHAAFYDLLANTSKTEVTLTVSVPRTDGERGMMGPLQLPLDTL